MNTAVFTFVNGILLRPPQGVSETRKMIELWLKRPKQTGPQGYLPFNYPDYAYYRDHARSLEGLTGLRWRWRGRDLESRGVGADSERGGGVGELLFAAGSECGAGTHAVSG